MRESLIPYVRTPILCTAFLETFNHLETEEVRLLCTTVRLYDYERGRLLTSTDHCWLWMKQPAYKVITDFSTLTDTKLTLHDALNFCGMVLPYTRTDGTKDYGIRLRDFYPVTQTQQEILRKSNSKRFCALPPKEKLDLLLAFQAYKLRLEHSVCDWRDLAKYSRKDAMVMVNGQIAHLKGWLYPVYGKYKVEKLLQNQMAEVKNQLEQW